MKRSLRQVDSRAVPEATDDIGMSHSIEGHRFILEVCNQRLFELDIRRVIEIHVQRLDDDSSGSALRSFIIPGHIDLGVAAAAQTFKNVVASVEPGLL